MSLAWNEVKSRQNGINVSAPINFSALAFERVQKGQSIRNFKTRNNKNHPKFLLLLIYWLSLDNHAEFVCCLIIQYASMRNLSRAQAWYVFMISLRSGLLQMAEFLVKWCRRIFENYLKVYCTLVMSEIWLADFISFQVDTLIPATLIRRAVFELPCEMWTKIKFFIKIYLSTYSTECDERQKYNVMFRSTSHRTSLWGRFFE